MSDEPAAVRVTLPVIYETLLDVKAKVDPIPGIVLDHESRIRVLEARVWQAAGACSVLGILAGAAAGKLF